MPPGGHNRINGGKVEAVRSLDVMALARASYVGGGRLGWWQWTYASGDRASINIFGGGESIMLSYRCRDWNTEAWQDVEQRVPILWTPCRFGSRRPWFLRACSSNGRYCGRKVAKLYGARGACSPAGTATGLSMLCNGGMRWIGDPTGLASCIGRSGPITSDWMMVGQTNRSGCGVRRRAGC